LIWFPNNGGSRIAQQINKAFGVNIDKDVVTQFLRGVSAIFATFVFPCRIH